MSKPRLGYWKIRGLAQPIRLLLHYCGEDFEDEMYEQGDGPGFSRECWTSVKNTLGLDFPNLPYYIDGDLKMTQSNTIIRYIASKHNKLGETPKAKVDCDMMIENAMDFRNGTVGVAYNPNYEKLKEEYFKKVDVKLQAFSKYLDKKKWFAGDKVTACDFPMYELLDQHERMKPGILADYENLGEFMNRFKELPGVKEYLESEKSRSLPINNKSAAFS